MNIPFTLGFAIFVELLTIYLRFCFNWESRKLQHKYLPFRIHHMYIGGFLMLSGLFYNPVFLSEGLFSSVLLAPTLFEVGFAVLLSDVIHHFLVLPAMHKHMDFP